MRRLLTPIVLMVVAFSLFSCGSSKKIVYFSNIDSISLEKSKGLFDAKIMPKDLLAITVNTTDPKAALPFNLTGGSQNNSSMQNNLDKMMSGVNYLVDNDGTINFPVVGKIKVDGLTKGQCETLIFNKIKPYMSDSENPIVTVRMASFKVSVVGEVAKPGVFTVDNEKINVLQALAEAGDMTMYGKRGNVMLIREDATGRKSVHRLDMTDGNLVNSPYYYMQQNDVLYVEPNKTKINNSVLQGATIWISGLSALTSITSLIVTLTR